MKTAMSRLPAVLGSLLILISGLPLTGEGEEYFRAQVSTPVVDLGDAFVYTVEAMTAGEEQGEPLIELAPLENFFQVQDVFSRSSVNILNGKTHVVSYKEVHAVADRTGELTIPPATVYVLDPDTGGKVRRRTNAVNLTVKTAKGEAAQATPTPEIGVLRPIKKRAHISLAQWMPFAVGLAVIAAMLAAAYVLSRRSRREMGEPQEPVDPRTPEQRALEDLEASRALKDRKEIPAYYFALSAILRRYLREIFNFQAEAATTPELLRELERLECYPDYREAVRDFCQESDRVKFANLPPPDERLATAEQRLRDLIEAPEKKPEPRPEPEIEPSSGGQPPDDGVGGAAAGTQETSRTEAAAPAETRSERRT